MGAVTAEAAMMEAELESGLGTLINLSGKMRMLSHRVAMFALLAAHAGDNASLRELETALNDFSGILDAIQHGSKELGISDEVARVLRNAGALSPTVSYTIERFIAEARQVLRALQSRRCQLQQLAAFARFVSSDLLQALNEVTGNIGKTLQQRLDLRNAQEDLTRRAVRDAIESIDHVSQQVKLISLNASIEASHAGDKGRGFGVIAAEIRALGEEAARATRGIMQQMS